MGSIMKLYTYQVDGRNFLQEKKYALLGDEMGLGKTVQAIAATENLQGPVLVICPAMLRYTWEREIETYFKEQYDIKFDVINHGPKANAEYISDKNVIHIISYEGLSKLPKGFLPRIVIFDEAHYLKSMKAKRTHAAHELVFRTAPEYLWLLTGTPIKNNVTEFYSLLKLLSYCPSGTNGLKVKEKSQYAFNMRFSNPRTRTIYVGRGKNKRHVEITEYHGIRNLEKLREYLSGKYLRRLAKSVLDLPELIDKDVLLKDRVSKHDRALRHAFDNRSLFNDGHVSTLKAGNALEKAILTGKYVADLVEQGESVVVFTDHIKSAEEISKFLEDKAIKSYCITGQLAASSREDLVCSFQQGDVSVLVATVGAAGTGFTLTAARHLVFNDLPWVPADIDQARKRIHRVGQSKGCVIHYMLSSPIDLYIKEKLTEKKKTLRKVT